MLENLHVKDLALISEADISFGQGFNILTGETGAGKSIILGSINMALGQKTGADVIRSGADTALIELQFSLTENEQNIVKAMELPVEEDGFLVLQRRIQPNRSICRVNGETVTLSQLKELRPVLLNIFGQHEHQSLLKSSTYVRMLDEYAGDEVAILQNELSTQLKKYRELIALRDNEDTDPSVRARQIELLNYEINEIESAALIAGEDEELEKRYRFLSNARKIMDNVSASYQLTGYEDNQAAGTNIGRALNLINLVTEYDEEVNGLSEQLNEIDSLLSDFNRAVSTYIDRFSFDEEEFYSIEERLNVINKLKDKYGASIDDVLAALDNKQEELLKLTNFEEYLDGINKDIERLNKEILDKCSCISKLRLKAAPSLTDSLIKAMVELNFLEVRLEIKIEPNENAVTENGYDDIEFLISLNPGENMHPMQNVASGGELSRIMLAFKSVFADRSDVSTLIFDEIDTGISGVTAYKVAEKMNSLSASHQLICITHLPQIAAMADSHYLINKEVEDGRTLTKIKLLDEEESVGELARMLGSDTITESALNNARELKKKR